MGTKLSKGGKHKEAEDVLQVENATTFDKTSTLPASFKNKTTGENKADSLPRNAGTKLQRNASFSKRLRKSCRNWAKEKGIYDGKKKPVEKEEEKKEPKVEGDEHENDQLAGTMPTIEVTDTSAESANSSAEGKDIASVVAEMVVEAQKKKAASRAQSREMLNKSDTKSEESLSKNNFHILKDVDDDKHDEKSAEEVITEKEGVGSQPAIDPMDNKPEDNNKGIPSQPMEQDDEYETREKYDPLTQEIDTNRVDDSPTAATTGILDPDNHEGTTQENGHISNGFPESANEQNIDDANEDMDVQENANLQTQQTTLPVDEIVKDITEDLIDSSIHMHMTNEETNKENVEIVTNVIEDLVISAANNTNTFTEEEVTESEELESNDETSEITEDLQSAMPPVDFIKKEKELKLNDFDVIDMTLESAKRLS